MSIYQEVQDLESLLNDCADPLTGEITEEDAVAYDALKTELTHNGLERLSKVRANKLADIEGLRAELSRLGESLVKAQKVVNWLENYMLLIYNQAPKDKKGKVQAGSFTVGIRKSAQVVIEDESLLPASFTRQKTEILPDKEKIKETLKSGISVPGAFLKSVQHIAIK